MPQDAQTSLRLHCTTRLSSMISRKFFSAQVTLPADTATSLLTLMRNSPLHWTLESDLNTPSLDSITGSEVGFIPSATVYVGSDLNVRGASPPAGTYTGVAAAAGQNYSLQDFGDDYGIIDPTQIWLYQQSGCTLDLTFQAR